MILHNRDIYMTRGDSECMRVTQWEYSLDDDGSDMEGKIKMDGKIYVFKPFMPGDIVELTVRKTVYKHEIMLNKKVTEFDEGIVYISIEPEDTKDLEYGQYTYDVQVIFGESGQVKTLVLPHLFEIGGECTW